MRRYGATPSASPFFGCCASPCPCGVSGPSRCCSVRMAAQRRTHRSSCLAARGTRQDSPLEGRARHRRSSRAAPGARWRLSRRRERAAARCAPRTTAGARSRTRRSDHPARRCHTRSTCAPRESKCSAVVTAVEILREMLAPRRHPPRQTPPQLPRTPCRPQRWMADPPRCRGRALWRRPFASSSSCPCGASGPSRCCSVRMAASTADSARSSARPCTFAPTRRCAGRWSSGGHCTSLRTGCSQLLRRLLGVPKPSAAAAAAAVSAAAPAPPFSCCVGTLAAPRYS